MKKRLTAIITAAIMAFSAVMITAGADNTSVWKPNTVRVGEKLDRGLAAMMTDDGVYLSWRVYADEDAVYGTAKKNVTYDIYRDGKPLAYDVDAGNYIDTDGTANSQYQVIRSYGDLNSCAAVKPFKTGSNYFDIPITDRPAATSLPRTATFQNNNGNEYLNFVDEEGREVNSWRTGNPAYDLCEYTLNDASCGDLDGDGEYEIVVKWDCNSRDNSQTGVTGTVYIDAYKLDGTRLWRIDLGQNIRAGAHYTQFLVYDLDGDGKAEVACKTAPGSKDAAGTYVTKASGDRDIAAVTDAINQTDYRNDSGYVLDGPEYYTVFNGMTGAAMDTIEYPFPRGTVSAWGDSYGNRVDRFLGDIAYLDGENPYIITLRGYYTRTTVAAIGFKNGKMSIYKTFDSDVAGGRYAGQGNHNMTVADVDNDGRDEVITGAICWDDDLSVKWCSGYGHGDALHIGDYDPTSDGFEYFSVHEGSTGMSVYNAATGETFFHNTAGGDTGRGVMANVGSGGYYQIVSSNAGNYQNNGGNSFTEINNGMSQNFRIFWDGDLYDNLLDGTGITDWNGKGMSRIFSADGCVSINGTKANPSLQADLFGDWREEVVYPLSDSSALRVYTTNIYTPYKMKSLMYDGVYRSGVASEQTGYNQPPHISYYLDPEKTHQAAPDDASSETVYEKGTSADTAWLLSDTSEWTKSGTADLAYKADGADYGALSISQKAPSDSFSASKTFALKDNASVNYDLSWHYGGVNNRNSGGSGTNSANYTYVQIGDKIRFAWHGGPSNYIVYYSTDGGDTYTATSINNQKSGDCSISAAYNTSTKTLTSLALNGKALVKNFALSDTPDTVHFGFSRGSVGLYDGNTTPESILNSIKVTQSENKEQPSLTPRPVLDPDETIPPEPTITPGSMETPKPTATPGSMATPEPPVPSPVSVVYNPYTRTAEFNSSKASDSAAVIFACYEENGVLKSTCITTAAVTAGTVNFVKANDSFDDDGNVRVYVWNSAGGMKPMDVDGSGITIPTPEPEPVKIMPLGDSITNGFSVAGAYRNELCALIENGGLSDMVDFVGSQKTGTGYDNDNEGHSGWAIEAIPKADDCEGKGRSGLATNIDSWMKKYTPDIVLLQIGTNDILSLYKPSEAPTRLESLVDKVMAKLPKDGKLYLATIPYISQTANYNKTGKTQSELDEIVNTYNTSVKALAQKKGLTLVDINSCVTLSDLKDGIHPTADGYAKMGRLWYSTLEGEIRARVE